MVFGQKLRVELDRQNRSIRGLARELADRSHTSRESWRRMLNRYLVGQLPEPSTRHLIEDTLGLERGALASDDEEEELMADLLLNLNEAINRISTHYLTKGNRAAVRS